MRFSASALALLALSSAFVTAENSAKASKSGAPSTSATFEPASKSSKQGKGSKAAVGDSVFIGEGHCEDSLDREYDYAVTYEQPTVVSEQQCLNSCIKIRGFVGFEIYEDLNTDPDIHRCVCLHQDDTLPGSRYIAQGSIATPDNLNGNGEIEKYNPYPGAQCFKFESFTPFETKAPTPTKIPTARPTKSPTLKPTSSPTRAPTRKPTFSPTIPGATTNPTSAPVTSAPVTSAPTVC